MKVKLNVSNSAGAKPGEVVEVQEGEGRTLIHGGFATEERTSRKAPSKKQKAEASAEVSTTTKKEG